ncbi:UDP-glycosyltransferase 73C2 [Morus notabilis]|uniref:UDP-glycosyltransferase 73C2 n=1 Tax=Morus notabilis TaxID=981085 RepID=W9STY4_9ROSA|nr:scopoletin glucosyltransferase [Morus notabilis]EXC26266.1 UDP-glycosyltransferase 73C2 [Morus notabilis]
MAKKIWVVPFFGQGHLFPSMELCKQVASRDFNTVLVIPSNLSSSVPASLRQHPRVEIAEIPSSVRDPTLPGSDDPTHHHHGHRNSMGMGLENLLEARTTGPDGVQPACAVVDVMMDWTAEIFQKFEVPTVGFFTSGACSVAMEYARWKAHPIDVKPGEVRLLPGLPEEMGVTYLDTKQQHHRPPGHRATHHSAGQPGPFLGSTPPDPPPPFGGPWSQRKGPPKPGDHPLWLDGIKGSIALMINTYDDLERPFIEYISSQIGKPVWGVGPLLPEQYWKSVGSIVHDHKIRNNRQSNVTEDEVIQWLDSKPRGSVLYVSFGSEVGPSIEDYPQLADALEASTRPFIWVIQPGSGKPGPRMPLGSDSVEEGYFPHGLDSRVGQRGLIVRGWAPQLLILSHPSTGGFLSHCGWNSTVEAIGRGVPFLVWPIRGDQYHNAKLVVAHLKVGYMVSHDFTEKMKKEDIVQGIERLMDDGEAKQRAITLAAKFENGFPISSSAALDAFRDFLYDTTV